MIGKEIRTEKPVLWNSNYVKVWIANFMLFFAFYLLAPLLPFLIALLCVMAVLLGIQGVVFDMSTPPAAIVYGQPFEYEAGAVMGSVRYEYAEEGSDEWTAAQPVRAGSTREKKKHQPPDRRRSCRFPFLRHLKQFCCESWHPASCGSTRSGWAGPSCHGLGRGPERYGRSHDVRPACYDS